MVATWLMQANKYIDGLCSNPAKNDSQIVPLISKVSHLLAQMIVDWSNVPTLPRTFDQSTISRQSLLSWDIFSILKFLVVGFYNANQSWNLYVSIVDM